MLLLDNGPLQMNGSRLHTLLKRSIIDAEKVFNYAIGERPMREDDIEDHLYELGMLEEGIYTVSVEIYKLTKM